MQVANKRFVWGIILAWIPWITAVPFVAATFRRVYMGRAVGDDEWLFDLVAVFFLCGVGTVIAAEATAIVFLWRFLSTGNRPRNVFSLLSIVLRGSTVIALIFFAVFAMLRIGHV
jgi:hypothetical protein